MQIGYYCACPHDVQTFLHIKYILYATNQELQEALWHPLSQFPLAPPLQYLFLGISVTSVTVSPGRASTFPCMSISCSEIIHSVQCGIRRKRGI